MGDTIELTCLFNDGEWRKIINEYSFTSDSKKYLWVYPSEENLNFLDACLRDLDCQMIVSVGCGCGLLEWIITMALGVQVYGIEVDDMWWNCKYAPKTFIPLHYCRENLDQDLATLDLLQAKKSAILFCYFNNGSAFETYLKHFTGSVLIIIGPGEGRHTHTNPAPFDKDLLSNWRLFKYQEVRNTHDFIAVYKKSKLPV